MKLLKTLIVAGLFTMNAAALAHTGIKSTYPANEQMLEAAPKQLTLNFGAPVRLMKVVLMDGEHKDLGMEFKPSADANASFKVAAPAMTMGEYMVSWVAMGEDGHKMTGDFSFMVHGEGMEMGLSHDDGHGEAHKDKAHDH